MLVLLLATWHMHLIAAIHVVTCSLATSCMYIDYLHADVQYDITTFILIITIQYCVPLFG